MALLRQIINGQRVNTINVDASADDLNALKSLLEGKVEEWDKKAEGGTATTMPDVLNPMRFSVGKPFGKSYRSCSFKIHHINPAKNEEDIEPTLIGNFDCRYDLDEKCEYAHLLGDNR